MKAKKKNRSRKAFRSNSGHLSRFETQAGYIVLVAALLALLVSFHEARSRFRSANRAQAQAALTETELGK